MLATRRRQVPQDIIVRLRRACLALPEAQEQSAWVGTRWQVRKKTFVHVLMVDSGWPPAYARAAGCSGPACVMTFRSPLPQLDLHAYTWEPFFRPGWWPNIVGMRLGGGTDWNQVAALVIESWRVVAPKKLAEAFSTRVPRHPRPATT